MSIKTSFTKLFTKFCEQGVSDRANFLKNTAVIGWALSSLAQTCAIFFNDKIPSKEKRFLIPQEIFDGIINATLFWFITSKAANFGKLLVLKKRVLPKSLSSFMENYKPSGVTIDKIKDNFLKHLKKAGGNAENIKTAQNAIEGMGVATGIVGAIISNNIVTPLLRNTLAGKWQKRDLEKIKDNAPLNPYFGKIDKEKYNFKKPLKTPSFGSYSSGLKI